MNRRARLFNHQGDVFWTPPETMEYEEKYREPESSAKHPNTINNRNLFVAGDLDMMAWIADMENGRVVETDLTTNYVIVSRLEMQDRWMGLL